MRRMIAVVRSIWTWSAMAALIVAWLPLLAVIRLFDRDPAHYRTGRWFRRLGSAMTRVNPSWRITISGTPVADPRRPYVVVCNHQSNADIPLISRLPWDMKWVAKIELFQVPFVGRLMKLAGDIPVDRENRASGARALVVARQYLDKKCSVMFFPEGTRSKDGRVLPFTDGAFSLAIKAGAPVLPLAIEGTMDALPKGSWLFGPTRTFQLKVFPPVETAGLSRNDAAALRERVRALIVEQVAAWRGVAPEAVDALPAPVEAPPDPPPSPV